MPQTDYYAVLGLKPGATVEDVRKAYILRTKILHPDRFDRSKQPVEWQQANEMLRDLNVAYAALRDRSNNSAAGPSASRTEGGSEESKTAPPNAQETRRTARATKPFKKPPPADVRMRSSSKRSKFIWLAAGVGGSFVLAVIAGIVNSLSHPQTSPPQRLGPPHVVEVADRQKETKFDPSSAVPVASEPQLPESFPRNGYIWSQDSAESRLAPLEVTTPAGGGNYFVKVEDWDTSRNVLDFFVYAGTTVKVHVPLGTYRIKYAIGEIWNGPEFLFGPSTTYARVDNKFEFKQGEKGYEGCTITFGMQRNGNPGRIPIKKTDF